jgi:hypothetical protein
MIKIKDIVPGKIISPCTYDSFMTAGEHFSGWDSWDRLGTGQPTFMIVGFQEKIKRRHSKKTARRDGFMILLIRFGGEAVLREVVMTPFEMTCWQRMF